VSILYFSLNSWAKKIEYGYYIQQTNPVDSAKADSLKNAVYTPTKQPTFIQKDRFGDPFSNFLSNSPLLLRDPASLKLDLEIDTGMNYTIYEKIGDVNYRPTSTMTFGEFNRYQDREIIKSYWKDRSSGLDGESAVSGRRLIPKIYISPVFDRIFGGSYVDIEPTGFVNLDFGGRWQRINNPSIPINQQKNGGFNFNQQISMNVVGKVGEKLAISANFDNNNSFDFQNNLKVEYTGYEEDIIKKIEIGNVSMNVSNSLMSGGQSLFGIKTQLQFGKLFVTALATRQQSTYKQLVINDGAVQNSNSAYTNSTSNSISGGGFEIRASDYVENRHFFLGHFFRENYENWLSRLPNIISSVNVTRLDVYVVNRSRDTETLRNVVGLMDLAEGNRVFNEMVPGFNPGTTIKPNDNDANGLFSAVRNDNDIRGVETASDYLSNSFGMTQTNDFEITQARKLQINEYIWNKELGYITLQRPLQNDEVLAVAYEYSYNGTNYKVGEMSEDYPGESDDYHIILKLLRPSKINTDVPTWDLMMKNIYNLNTQSISQDGFTLRVHYKDDNTGIDNPSLHEGANTKDIPLIEILGLDRLNVNGDPQKDANFDYIEGITIDENRGNVIFPVLEPFGRTLEKQFTASEQTLKNKYVYDTLYRDTRVNAAQISSLNKFYIVGTNKSSSSNSEYNIPAFNVNKGSVVVKAGNTILTEGLHYTIDSFGKVRIIDEGIASSGKQITIDYESPDLFNFQTKWLTGARFDYRFNDKTNFGATILHLNERPGGISRFSVGDEPLKNTKYGFDFNFQDKSRMLTKMVDALPLINTKEESSISFNAEFAQLIPGTSNKVNGEGTSYIDDFENATTPFNIGGNHIPWKLGATPRTSDDRFNHSASDLSYAYKRAKMAWYVIDNAFYRSGGNKPSNLSDEDLINNYVKGIIPQDIFRERDRQVVNVNEPIFDIAYYPSERGPYNYNPDLTADGLLPNPRENFGAITRANTTEINWEETNVEYVEFWMMDPFISGDNGKVLDGIFDQNNTTGGELVFNFGDVSEDVMKDNRHAFEQGLPGNGSDLNTITNQWGKVAEDYLTDFFDNTASARENQDVGLDGLKSSEEETFFNDSYLTQINPQALQRVIKDVSADDFEYFLSDNHDNLDHKILERYKNFNGMEGNSPIQTGNQSFSPSSTNLPDREDLNGNASVSNLEEFFEYRINLRPGQLKVNEGYIVDQVTDLAGAADWYLFRIPVKSPDRIIGEPKLSNMKYYRVYLTGWSQPVVLRMAKFQTVGAQWRKSTLNLNKKGFNEIPETGTSDFDVSVVNIEENSVPTDGNSPYVIPPGLDRDLDNTSTISRQSNEQSLKICIDDLTDGDARAVYKIQTPAKNLIQYGRLRMFFHAESNNDPFLQDDEVTGFIRLGSDEAENYYEIEVPLKITPENLTEVGDDLRRAVWPEANEIDISLDELLSVKSRRNRGDFDNTQAFSFPTTDGKYKITVEGNPDLSALPVIMIGVRNTRSDDLQEKSICIWANEMRVSDLDSQNGWAANARLSAKLADFATINASTRYTSVGFGGIQDKIAQRTINETTQYDLSANVNIDKLLPGKTGLKIPMFVSFERSISKPKFDPLDPDTELDVTLLSIDGEDGSNYEKLVQDRSTRKSINFTNVRKEKVKPDAKSHIYDIENFSFNYSFSESSVSNVNTESFIQKQVGGGFAYNYSPQAPSIEPFKDSKALSGKYLQLIKDINFSPFPNNLSMRADLDRRFTKRQLRNGDLTTEGIDPYFEKYFNFDRSYNLRWSIFKSVSLDYTARANAIIDEPEGDLNTQAKRDSVWNNLKNLGRLKRFDQTFSANYRLPLDKIPFTNWMSADLRYSAGYNWEGASFDQIEEFGNTISNNRDRSITSKVDMVKLYNKVGFLKKINAPTRRNSNSRTRATAVKKDTTARKGDNKLVKGILRLAMSLRSVNLTFSNRQSTSLPGFRPRAYLFGLDSGFNAPGLGFVFGSQDPNIRFDAADNGWLVKSPILTSAFRQSLTQDIGLKASLEPAKDIKIQLDLKRSNSGSFQEIFRFDSLTNDFRSLTPSRSGSYNITFMSIATAFQKGDSISSPAFSAFEDYRSIIQRRLNSENNKGTYGLNSQDVLIPAFIAAYGGKDPNKVALTPFPKIPLPNWRIDYAGLSKIPALANIFSSINITHSYSSTFSVSNYTNSTAYNSDLSLDNDITDYPKPFQSNENGELIPVYIVNEVAISERFSPLLGINVRTKGRTTAKIEWKKERNLALNMSNSQMTELSSNDISFDFGFSKEKMKLPFKINGRTVVINNDVQFRMSFTVRDTETIQRKLDDVSTVTNGNINYQLRPQLTYSANDKLNLTMYFERNINRPRVSNSFDRANSAFGVQMRFSLAQ
jgi:cell surface protein SprA